jgi:hypothetical protein
MAPSSRVLPSYERFSASGSCGPRHSRGDGGIAGVGRVSDRRRLRTPRRAVSDTKDDVGRLIAGPAALWNVVEEALDSCSAGPLCPNGRAALDPTQRCQERSVELTCAFSLNLRADPQPGLGRLDGGVREEITQGGEYFLRVCGTDIRIEVESCGHFPGVSQTAVESLTIGFSGTPLKVR